MNCIIVVLITVFLSGAEIKAKPYDDNVIINKLRHMIEEEKAILKKEPVSENNVARSIEARAIQSYSSLTVRKDDVNGIYGTENYLVQDMSMHAHNVIRAKYGVPDLAWNESLATDAQTHADAVAAHGLNIFHSAKAIAGGCGENVGVKCISFPTVYSPAFSTFSWYEEVALYDYNNPGFSSATGHFTQVVWKNTETLGCGLSTNLIGGMYYTYLVCQYYPPGNYLNQFPGNVLPLQGSAPTMEDITLEGDCDYSGSCSSYISYCAQYASVSDTCRCTCP